MAKVSICVPCYNNIDDVIRLIESIQNQTYTDYEIIINDDSEDESIASYIGDLSDDDFDEDGIFEKIDYIHNVRKLGPVYNWNATLERATGEYIKIMFSDDWFTYPDSLEKMVRMLDERPDAGLAFCGSRQVTLGDVITEHNVSEEKTYDRYAPDDYIHAMYHDYKYLFISNQIGAPSATIYRNSLHVKFNEKTNWASDVFLYMDILGKNPRFEYTKEPLISIGMHENQYTESFSSNDKRVFRDYKYMYKRYGLRHDKVYSEYYRNEYKKPYVIERVKAPCRKLRDGLKKRK